jgi:hypothetical protein
LGRCSKAPGWCPWNVQYELHDIGWSLLDKLHVKILGNWVIFTLIYIYVSSHFFRIFWGKWFPSLFAGSPFQHTQTLSSACLHDPPEAAPVALKMVVIIRPAMGIIPAHSPSFQWRKRTASVITIHPEYG